MFIKSDTLKWSVRLLITGLAALLAGCLSRPPAALPEQAVNARGVLIKQAGGFTWRHCDGRLEPLTDLSKELQMRWADLAPPADWPVFFRGYLLAAQGGQAARLVRLDQLGGGLEMCQRTTQGYLYRARGEGWVMDLLPEHLVVRMPSAKRQLSIAMEKNGLGQWRGQLEAGPLRYSARLQIRVEGCKKDKNWYRWQARLVLNGAVMQACAVSGELSSALHTLSGQRAGQVVKLVFGESGRFRASLLSEGRQRLVVGNWQQLGKRKRLLQLTELAGRPVEQVWVLHIDMQGYRLSAPDEVFDDLILQMHKTDSPG